MTGSNEGRRRERLMSGSIGTCCEKICYIYINVRHGEDESWGECEGYYVKDKEVYASHCDAIIAVGGYEAY